MYTPIRFLIHLFSYSYRPPSFQVLSHLLSWLIFLCRVSAGRQRYRVLFIRVAMLHHIQQTRFHRSPPVLQLHNLLFSDVLWVSGEVIIVILFIPETSQKFIFSILTILESLHWSSPTTNSSSASLRV